MDKSQRKPIKYLNDKLHILKSKADKHPHAFLAVLAIALNLVMEIICRLSFVSAIKFLLLTPHYFLMNTAILFLLFSLSLLLKKRYALISVLCVLWLGLAIADSIVRVYKITPLSFQDILLLKSTFTIIDTYLPFFGIILIGIALVGLTVLLVYFITKQKKYPVNYKISGIVSGVALAVVSVLLIIGANSKSMKEEYTDMRQAYNKYGFVYSFTISSVDRGISQPIDYSKDCKQIVSELQKIKTNDVSAETNIVFVQLESFFDVKYLQNVKYSEDPVPFFTGLKSKYPHGFLCVPTIGAGTVNTEFEIITQMATDYFGVGEIPFESVMAELSCESVCFNLKELGYSCHAIHNHQGSFYSRNIVYGNIGFDTFTPVEYMNNCEKNALGWVKDKVLTQEILKAMKSTEGLDYVYTVSVQPHGKYIDTPPETPFKIQIESGMDEKKYAFEYYINQLYEVDCFISDLCNALSSLDEKTVLVLYGDHLPAFDIASTDLENQNLYQTEYVVWSNFGFEPKSVDLEAYRLSSYIMENLGINNGNFTKLHQNFSTDAKYKDYFDLLQYDALFGEKYATNGIGYTPSDLTLGIDKIEITDVRQVNDGVFINGKNFTDYSVVFVNGEEIRTMFIDSGTLIVFLGDIEEKECIFTVKQVCVDGVALSETEGFSVTLNK